MSEDMQDCRVRRWQEVQGCMYNVDGVQGYMYRGTRVQVLVQGYRGTILCRKKMAAGKGVQVLGVTGA